MERARECGWITKVYQHLIDGANIAAGCVVAMGETEREIDTYNT